MSSSEYLDIGSGGPLPPASTGSGRRTALVAGGIVAGVALLGAGAWAAWSFFATGAQPAEALPETTIAYASIDLDPSGGQKIEALRTLQKFPAFEDEVGLDTDDDVRQWIFEKIQDSGGCADLDYADDIETWLGDRFAIAAVDAGNEEPDPVFVLQVGDEDAADEGLRKLSDCADGEGAWVIADGWALVGETQEIVDRVSEDAADAPLSDDDDFTRWTDAAGDPGIVSLYAAPEAGALIAEELDFFGGMGQALAPPIDCEAPCEGYALEDPAAEDEITEALEDFEGAAATVRFDDGGLELELAGDAGEYGDAVTSGDQAGDTVSTLPADTAVAVGLAFGEDWFADLVDQIAAGEGSTADELMDQISEETGLDLPDDVQTLLGDSVAIAIGPDFDPDGLFASSEPDDFPTGVKLSGDPDEIDSVLDKLREIVGPDAGLIDSDQGDGVVVVGPDADYRGLLVEDGGLGDEDAFRDVVEHADGASGIVYVDLDAEWLTGLWHDDEEARENLDPLDAFGLSTWLDDDAVHAVVKVTTD
ncbi:DUF3352 domain-containing protein [Nocardioides sp. SR21]|uniref:DUF3352 domain-containing protein n=1 Tax=Nocardioides sp. SR21 TaxID=2919501 RepID=UPI001FA977E6|nr:DUF3352 domain-containing protein [Nocardioides sp. SR21]